MSRIVSSCEDCRVVLLSCGHGLTIVETAPLPGITTNGVWDELDCPYCEHHDSIDK